MKPFTNHLRGLLTAALMTAAATTASADDKFYQPRELVQVSNDDVQLAYNELSSSVFVQTKSAVDFYCRSPWLNATLEGSTIRITATENPLFVPRTAKIILTTRKENVSRVISVTQKPEPGHNQHFALPAQDSICPMASMDLSKATHDPYIASVLKNRAVESSQARLKNNTYETSVGTHAPSSFKIQLNGATRFVTDLGIDDEVLKKDTATHGNATYRLLLDGKEAASGTITIGDRDAVHIDLDTSGAKTLEIVFDTNGSNWGDHIDMGNPYFVTGAGKPVLTD